ncbi:hypothetical protein GALMADRAFT_1226269 [Galerina marginata CBS 339.88]|uniref:Uncharacterized protein n=1 Tax=Galerina marginata (strain CBS 339.88) TaxID=685588 RepID=A0A067T7J6_GALM3|nr:hypothetical protein GALMADRAFT_1226269 [Galerina marginata CBS 339.88]
MESCKIVMSALQRNERLWAAVWVVVCWWCETKGKGVRKRRTAGRCCAESSNFGQIGLVKYYEYCSNPYDFCKTTKSERSQIIECLRTR